MRPIEVSLGALGSTPWLPVNQVQNSFQIGLGVVLSSGASLTYNIQHTFDDPGQVPRLVSISRTTTVATVTDTAHGLSVGDNVLVNGSGSTSLDGSFNLATVIDANSYTYTCVNSGPAAGGVNTKLQSFPVFPHAVLTGQVARADGNYAFPIQAVRLNISVYASGTAYLKMLTGMGR